MADRKPKRKRISQNALRLTVATFVDATAGAGLDELEAFNLSWERSWRMLKDGEKGGGEWTDKEEGSIDRGGTVPTAIAANDDCCAPGEVETLASCSSLCPSEHVAESAFSQNLTAAVICSLPLADVHTSEVAEAAKNGNSDSPSPDEDDASRTSLRPLAVALESGVGVPQAAECRKHVSFALSTTWHDSDRVDASCVGAVLQHGEHLLDLLLADTYRRAMWAAARAWWDSGAAQPNLQDDRTCANPLCARIRKAFAAHAACDEPILCTAAAVAVSLCSHASKQWARTLKGRRRTDADGRKEVCCRAVGIDGGVESSGRGAEEEKASRMMLIDALRSSRSATASATASAGPA
eukprot:1342227-Rhodomonas_salina.1